MREPNIRSTMSLHPELSRLSGTQPLKYFTTLCPKIKMGFGLSSYLLEATAASIIGYFSWVSFLIFIARGLTMIKIIPKNWRKHIIFDCNLKFISLLKHAWPWPKWSNLVIFHLLCHNGWSLKSWLPKLEMCATSTSHDTVFSKYLWHSIEYFKCWYDFKLNVFSFSTLWKQKIVRWFFFVM